MKNLAIITARSGSKGLKDKNILKLNDIHLLGHTILAAINSNLFDEVFVSTDSVEYASIAEGYGASAYPLRSKELSTDTVSSSEVIQDILVNIKPGYETFTLLQPTSPFRNAQHIKDAMEIYIDKKANSVISLVKSDKSPEIINSINTDGTIDGFLKLDSSKYARQKQVNFIPNGAIFIVDVEYYIKYNDFYKERSYPYLMDKYSSIDIDDELDFKFCEFLINEKFNN